jgi:hypothetical protein
VGSVVLDRVETAAMGIDDIEAAGVMQFHDAP